MESYGTVRIKLKELLQEGSLSKNKLCYRAEFRRSQINNFCGNMVAGFH